MNSLRLGNHLRFGCYKSKSERDDGYTDLFWVLLKFECMNRRNAQQLNIFITDFAL